MSEDLKRAGTLTPLGQKHTAWIRTGNLPIVQRNRDDLTTDIWKPQKVYNDGIYLVYTRHMTTYSIYLEYTWYIPVI